MYTNDIQHVQLHGTDQEKGGLVQLALQMFLFSKLLLKPFLTKPLTGRSGLMTEWAGCNNSLVDSKLGFGPGVLGSIPSLGKNLVFRNAPCLFRILALNEGSPPMIELPMGHASANRKPPNDTPWEMLS